MILTIHQVNEGTVFSTSLLDLNTSSQEEDDALDAFVKEAVIDPSTISTNTLNRIRMIYPPNSTANGAPYSTGNSLFDRAAAWYTDNMFLAPRRLLFEKAALSGQKLFAYHFAELYPGSNPVLGGGVFHLLGNTRYSYFHQYHTDPNLL